MSGDFAQVLDTAPLENTAEVYIKTEDQSEPEAETEAEETTTEPPLVPCPDPSLGFSTPFGCFYIANKPPGRNFFDDFCETMPGDNVDLAKLDSPEVSYHLDLILTSNMSMWKAKCNQKRHDFSRNILICV